MQFLLGTNKKLRISHFFLFVYLLILLIAPKVPLSIGGSSVNLAIIVLLVWFIYYNVNRIGISLRNTLPQNLFLIFTVLALVSSILTFKSTVIFNAIQYLLYTWLVAVLINQYFKDVCVEDDFNITINIINSIGLLYSLGSIVSVFIGPIYPFQVGDNMRLWGGLVIQQGVGFGINQNSVGGILVLFLIFSSFFVISKYKNFFIIIYIVAILSTISRSTYLCLILGWLIYKLISISKDVILKPLRFNLKKVRNTFILLVILITPIVCFLRANIDYFEAMKIGFNLNETNIDDNEGSRIDQWVNGISSWEKSNGLQLTIGKGFKNSSQIVDGKYISAHNLYIQYLEDMGFIGLFLFLFSIGFFLVNVLTKIYTSKENKIYLFCLFSITSMLVHNFTETFLYGVDYVTFLILLFNMYSYAKVIDFDSKLVEHKFSNK